MAGEWIKVEASTADKPEVSRIARILKIPHDAVFGKLVRLWAWIDTNSVDGVVDGVVDADIDRLCHCDGFAAACSAVGWLVIDAAAERMSLPNFERHNGETAKQRAMKNRRQAKWRAGVDELVDVAASTKASTREEKRREEKAKAPIAPKGAVSEAAVLAAYHSILPGCQRVAVLNDKRKRRIAAAVKLARQVCESQQWDYDADEFWRGYFTECAADPWMRGDVPNPKSATWVQNLDVLLAEDRFASVMDRALATMRTAA